MTDDLPGTRVGPRARHRPVPSDKDECAERICLKCRRKFPSWRRFNRLCTYCAEENARVGYVYRPETRQ
jgi:hypothetical protein